MQQHFRHQLWILAAAGVIFFTNLGATALWDEDEPLYAACAWEMIQRGDWVVPTFNGELFPEKPPLGYWLMIAGYKMFGPTEFAARFWSALLAVGTALVTYHLGKRLFRLEVGFWAGLIVASSIIFTVSARAATLDSALVFVTTAAMLVFVVGTMAKQEKTGSTDPGLSAFRFPLSAFRFPYALLFYALLALAVLLKGPIGVALPVIAVGLFLLIVNRSREGETGRLMALARVFAPRNVLRTTWQLRPLTAIIVVAAIAVPWYVLVGLRTDGLFLREFFGEHNLGRALKPLQGHSGPFFYYIPAILIGFFPWSVFLGPSLIEAARRIRQRREWSVETVFAVCWVAVFVGLWSIPSTKLPHYVLTAYPALALLTAVFVDAWIAEPARVSRWWMRNATLTMIVVGVGMMIALPIVAAFYLPGQWSLGLVGLILVVGGGWAFLSAERDRPRRAMATFAVTSVAFLTAMFGFAALRVDRYQNAPVVMQEIRRDSTGEPQVAVYRFFRESLVYYAGRPVPTLKTDEQLQAFFDDAEHPYVVTLGEYEEELRQRFPDELRVVLRRPRFLRSGEVVVLTPRASDRDLHTAAKTDAHKLR